MFGGCGCEGGGGDVRCWKGFGLRYSVGFRGVGYWVVGEGRWLMVNAMGLGLGLTLMSVGSVEEMCWKGPG